MKFVHIADVHLGVKPDEGHAWSEERSEEIWETFRKIIDDVRAMRADLLLIAGDLFHRPPSKADLLKVNDLFATIPETRVVLIAGNHDYVGALSAWKRFNWNRNVAALMEPECECVRFPEIGTEVYGFSYDSQTMEEPLDENLHPLDNEYFHILMVHGGDASHIPMKKEALAASGFNYIALGHIHRPGVVLRNKAVYPGSPEPIDCAEEGPHGYVVGDVNGKHVSVRFVPCAKRSYMTLTVPCTADDTAWSIRERLGKMIQESGQQNIFRVILEGEQAKTGTPLQIQVLLDAGNVLDVTDRRESVLRAQDLKAKYGSTLIGRYMDSFQGQEIGQVEQLALQYGLEALEAAVREL